jgi:WD40 repeat protein
VVFSPDGFRVASTSWDNSVQEWDNAQRTELLSYSTQTFNHKIKFGDDSTKIVVDNELIPMPSQVPSYSNAAPLPKPVPICLLAV